MGLLWMSVNEKLQQGVHLINKLSNAEFGQLCAHTLNTKGESISNEENQQVLESLGLNKDDVHLLYQSIVHIFKQSSCVILKPTTLQKELTDDLGLDATKSEEFVKLWTSEMKKTFPNLENINQLNNFSWELNLETGSSSKMKEITPKVKVNFSVSKNNSSEQEKVNFELKENTLLQLYHTFENIQNKLDFIQNLSQ